MKTITQTFNIYKITELKGKAKENAIEHARNEFQEMIYSYHEEMLSTFKQAAKNLNIDITDFRKWQNLSRLIIDN